MMNPTFSVIIPVYKCEKYVEETVRSVLNQTCTNFECICVDDGSPDKSGEVLDRLANLDSRIRVFHKDNGGVSSARNLGIEMSKGEWLLFLDADDLWRVDLIENVDHAIRKFPSVDMVKFDFASFEDGDKWDARPIGMSELSFMQLGQTLPMNIAHTAMWQWAYRKKAVKDIRFNLAYHGMEDHPYKCEALLRAATSIAEIRGDYLGYRQRTGSHMHQAISVRTWEGELNHRVDILCLSEFGQRKIEGAARSSWLTGFVLHRFMIGLIGRPPSERKVLMHAWWDVLPKMLLLRDLSWQDKFLCRVCYLTRSRFVAEFMCLGFSRWLYEHTNTVRRGYRYLRKSGEYAKMR